MKPDIGLQNTAERMMITIMMIPKYLATPRLEAANAARPAAIIPNNADEMTRAIPVAIDSGSAA